MRQSEVTRNTLETRIRVAINLDGSGTSEIATGIGFFDHMLDQIARHGRIDLAVTADGDLHIDAHHTVEDVGITFGQALNKALGEKKGLVNHANITVHIDNLRGENSHHQAETVFKAFGRALRAACERDARASDDIPSTKGSL